MKRHLIAALAFIGTLGALPMAAHADHYDRGYGDWRGPSGYALFERDFRHAREGIRHGLRDGSFSRREVWQFRQELDRIRDLLDFYQNNDGHLSRREIRDIRRRFDRLHNYMHLAHDRGHEEQWWDFR